MPISRRRRPSEGHGFTLVELLVASLLAVILLTAVGGLLRAIWRQDRRTQRTVAKHPPTRILGLQLQRDFSNARAFSVTPGQIRLVGFVATDRTSGLPSLRPAEVTYRILVHRDRRLLLRHEVGLDEVARVPKSELVWIGAASLDVSHSDLQQEATGRSYVSAVPGVRAMPRQLRVVIRDVNGAVICAENIVHRDAS